MPERKKRYKAVVDHHFPTFLGERHAVLVAGCLPIIVGIVDPCNPEIDAKTAARADEIARILNRGFAAGD